MGEQRSGPCDGTLLPVETYWQDHFRIAKQLWPTVASLEHFHTFSPVYHIGDGRYLVPKPNEPARREYITRGLFRADILQTRNSYMIEHHNKSLGLAHPFPIALSPVKSNFGFSCRTEGGKFCFHNFHSAYAAKAFLVLIINGQEYKWMNNNKIMLDNGTTIQGEQDADLERALEYTPKGKEIEWIIPEPMMTYYRNFIGQGRIIGNGKIAETQTQVDGVSVNVTNGSQVARSPKPTRKADPDVQKVKARLKVKAGDHVTIADIAQQLGKNPRDCRAVLRSLRIDKPVSGNWAWPPAEAEKIKAKLKGKVK